MTGDKPHIVLASASPRRRELLEKAGFEFEVLPSNVDESGIAACSPKKLVKKLSREKACACPKKDGIVIGADTVVCLGKKVMGKPQTKENAVRMLKELSGKWHSVYTGVTVVKDGKVKSFAVRSLVKIKKLSNEQIEEYVERDLPLDKAGAYGIQDGIIVEKYRGSYTNIVGLPMEKLAKVLAR